MSVQSERYWSKKKNQSGVLSYHKANKYHNHKHPEHVFFSTLKKLFLTVVCPPTFSLILFCRITPLFSRFCFTCWFSSHSNGAGWDIESGSSLNLAPSNQTPMLLNSPTKCNLLPSAGAHRRCELQLCQIIPNSKDSSTCRHGPNIQHEDLSLGQLWNLSLLFCSLSPYTNKPSQQEEVYLQNWRTEWSATKVCFIIWECKYFIFFSTAFEKAKWILWLAFARYISWLLVTKTNTSADKQERKNK